MMTREMFNLLSEMEVLMYNETRNIQQNLLPGAEKGPVKRDLDAKMRMFYHIGLLLKDIMYYHGLNIPLILEQGVQQGLTLYRRDMNDHLDETMPPPPEK